MSDFVSGPFEDTIILDAEQPEEKPKRNNRRFLLPVAAAALGLAVGVTGVYVYHQNKVEDLKGTISTLNSNLDEVESLASDRQGRITTLESDLAASKAKVDEYASREAELTQRETDVAAKEGTVAARESAVTQTEQAIDASHIEPGTYLVPEELTAGRYRTVNEVTYCYIEQMKGDDIIDNILEDVGRPVFTVQNVPGSQVTIDSDCGPIAKI